MTGATRVLLLALATGAALSAAACRRDMAQTPTIVQAMMDPYGAVPPALRRPEARVVYVTDRRPAAPTGPSARYGHQRSEVVRIGVGDVRFGDGLTWDQLAGETSNGDRRRPIPLRLGRVQEQAVVSEPTLPTGALLNCLRAGEAPPQWDALAPTIHAAYPDGAPRDAFVYVHGFHRSFAHSMCTMAEMWHYGGRTGVPIIYSWPAGAPGTLRAYTRDRESGEFTVGRLKAFLVALAADPQIERVHLIAHSRGADVLATALRELHIGCVGAELDTRAALKIENVVLAAPDLDAEVAAERIFGEELHKAARRLTVYVCQRDLAMHTADWLYASANRFGRGRFANDEAAAAAFRAEGVSIIDVTLPPRGAGHDYFYDQPQVVSDLILLLSQNRDPGAEHGRPLIPRGNGCWELDAGYPRTPSAGSR